MLIDHMTQIESASGLTKLKANKKAWNQIRTKPVSDNTFM